MIRVLQSRFSTVNLLLKRHTDNKMQMNTKETKKLNPIGTKSFLQIFVSALT